jgi:FkbM family methyltransferase
MKCSMKLLFNKVLVNILMRAQRVEFPVRQMGGDEWVYQWRLNFLTNGLEKESLPWCRKLIRPGMVAVDIGAHIGYYTRIFSRLVGDSGRVFSFEPSSENFPVLSKNISAGNFQNVTIFNKAVGAENTQGTLFVSPGHSNHSLNAGFTESVGQEQVEIVPLDLVLHQYGISQMDFIKVDVEGSEINVLNGMKGIIAQSPNLHMLVEYNTRALRAGGFTPMDLPSLIESLGFEVHLILPDGSLSKDIPDTPETFNMLCSPAR